MNTIQIGRKRFSKFFWRIIEEKTLEDYDKAFDDLNAMFEHQQALRLKADYNTGSIDWTELEDVYRLIKFFNPSVIAEVGTFVGVSTMTMRVAAPHAVIHTCDMSNDLKVSSVEDELLFQYPRKPSYEMFQALADKEVKVDFVYLDGRLGQSDFEPLNKIVHEKTIFALDDFEGIEKGVANAMILEGPGRVLIYPRSSIRKTAVSLPLTMLQFVPQEAV